MKKLFIILFAGVLLSTGVAYAATTTQEAMLAQMIGLLKSIGENLALLISNQSVTKVDVSGSTDATSVGSLGVPTPKPVPAPMPEPTPKPVPVAGSPYRITNPSANNNIAWKVGSTYSIEWETTPTMGIISNTDYVDVYLTTGVSKTSIYKISVGERNAGKVKWTVPGSIIPGEYALAIQSFANPLTRAYSGTIEIVGKSVSAPSSGITSGGSKPAVEGQPVGRQETEIKPATMQWAITAPKAGEIWSIGKYKYIDWTGGKKTDTVTLQLRSTDKNITAPIVIAKNTLNLGRKLWKVSVKSGMYQIELIPTKAPEQIVQSGAILIRENSAVPLILQSAGKSISLRLCSNTSAKTSYYRDGSCVSGETDNGLKSVIPQGQGGGQSDQYNCFPRAININAPIGGGGNPPIGGDVIWCGEGYQGNSSCGSVGHVCCGSPGWCDGQNLTCTNNVCVLTHTGCFLHPATGCVTNPLACPSGSYEQSNDVCTPRTTPDKYQKTCCWN